MAPASAAVIRFGVFEADLRSGELRRSGVRVRLQDLPFRALALLLSRPGEVVTREEFRQALWPADVFVDFEQGISSAVMRLRDALGDSADNPIFIQTIERRGYRWIAPIHAPEPVVEATPKDTPIEEPRDTVELPAPSRSAAWRYGLVALPLALVLLAVWMFRPGRRPATAVANSSATVSSTPRKPANREAEDFYLKGRFLWNKRTPQSLTQAVDAFTQAIVHDPNYSDAYVGLADCYNLLREFSAMPSQEAYSRSFAAAKKAVELDEHSSEAHASLAFVTYYGMWDAANAEKEYRRAIELNPNDAKAHHWYATFLRYLDRDEEALREINVARKLDPNSSAILADQGELLESAGQREQAVRLLKQLEEADPNFVSPHRYLGAIDFKTGDYPGYIAEMKKDALLSRDAAKLAEAEASAKGFAKGGKRGMFEAQLSEQLKLYGQNKLIAYVVAASEARLGNKEEALKYLTISLQSHEESLVNLPRDRDFASLRGDPAFEQILAKVAPAQSR